MKFKRFIIIFIVIFVNIQLSGYAQSLSRDGKKRMNSANRHFRKNEFDKALPYYLLIEDDYRNTSEEANLIYKIGFCYYSSPLDKEKAIPYFEEYLSKNDSIFEAHFFIAKTHHFFNRFDQAINSYLDFKAYVENDTINDLMVVNAVLSSVDNEIQRCNYGKSLLKIPVDVVIENLSEINSIDSEYAPVISSDEKWMAFTKRSPESTGTGRKKSDDGDYFEDIYICEINVGSLFSKTDLKAKNRTGYFSALETFKSSKPKKIGMLVNTKDHEGAVQFSKDGKRLYIYRNYNLWASDLKMGIWQKPKPIANFETILDEEAFEPSFSISDDEMIIYFSSDREGGYGGLDIYRSEKQRDGSWSAPFNLGETINTNLDEDGPYVDPDGSTLYFSSKGHSSMGGYDVFKSKFNGLSWSPPQNMGFPINTGGNDIFYMMTPLFNRAYYSSNKFGGEGKMDLYRLTFADERTPLAEVKGMVIEGDSARPSFSTITVYDSDFNNELYTQYSDSADGNYLLTFNHGQDYAVKVETEGFAPYTKLFNIPAQVYYYQYYQEIHHIHIKDKVGNIIGQKISMQNAFFDIDSLKKDESFSQFVKNIDTDTPTLNYKELVDVKFYIPEDSLVKLAQTDTTLNLQLSKDADISFAMEVDESKTINMSDKFTFVPQSKVLPSNIQQPISITRKAVIHLQNIVIQTETALIAAQNELEKTNTPKALAFYEETKKRLAVTKKSLVETQKQITLTSDDSPQTKEALLTAQENFEDTRESLREVTNAIKMNPKSTKESLDLVENADLALAKSQNIIVQVQQIPVESKDTSAAAIKTNNTEGLLLATKKILETTEKKLKELSKSSTDASAAISKTQDLIVQTQKSLSESQSLYSGYENPSLRAEQSLIRTKELLAQTKNSMQVAQDNLLRTEILTPEAKEALKATKEVLLQSEIALSNLIVESNNQESIKKEETDAIKVTKQLLKETHKALRETQRELAMSELSTSDPKETLFKAKNLLDNTETKLNKAEKIIELTEASPDKSSDKMNEIKDILSDMQQDLLLSQSAIEKTEIPSSKIEESFNKTNQLLSESKFKLAESESSLEETENLLKAIEENSTQRKPLLAELILSEEDTAIVDYIDTKTEDQKSISEMEIKEEPLIKKEKPSLDLPKITLYFEYDKNELTQESKKKLKLLLNVMKIHSDIKFNVYGHTDANGPADYNRRLSLRRANAAVTKLVADGTKRNRFKVFGIGEDQPAAPNQSPDGEDNPDGRKLNRRVEFELIR